MYYNYLFTIDFKFYELPLIHSVAHLSFFFFLFLFLISNLGFENKQRKATNLTKSAKIVQNLMETNVSSIFLYLYLELFYLNILLVVILDPFQIFVSICKWIKCHWRSKSSFLWPLLPQWTNGQDIQWTTDHVSVSNIKSVSKNS